MLRQQGKASEGRVVGKSFSIHRILSGIFAILIVDPLLLYMQDFYMLVDGFEEKAEQVQETV
jgi:hypothetical protein